jgi:hypothetical protein
MLLTTPGLAKASAAVRDAKRALIDAEHRFDKERTPVNTNSLIAEVQAAERRLAEATATLRAVARSPR